jgi:nicotinamide-nucleotide amidase
MQRMPGADGVLDSQYVYTAELEQAARRALAAAHEAGLRIATAESCTGGALAALLTDVEGLSHVFERGFAVYSDEAKSACLGVAPELIADKGAVSKEVALAMAKGALHHSVADISVAITGFAGPAGKNDEEGLVHLAAAQREAEPLNAERHFGAIGRTAVRIAALRAAIELLCAYLDRADHRSP